MILNEEDARGSIVDGCHSSFIRARPRSRLGQSEKKMTARTARPRHVARSALLYLQPQVIQQMELDIMWEGKGQFPDGLGRVKLFS